MLRIPSVKYFPAHSKRDRCELEEGLSAVWQEQKGFLEVSIQNGQID
jgi:hypothetical protein